MLETTNKKRGFTLIEVVLVLAIAGLIMVIVFLALQGAQRSRRDTQRKNDLSRVAAQLESYASNNNGDYPASLTAGTPSFNAAYLSNMNLADPSTGGAYNFATTDQTNSCAGTPATIGYRRPNLRTYILTMCLEQGATRRTNN